MLIATGAGVLIVAIGAFYLGQKSTSPARLPAGVSATGVSEARTVTWYVDHDAERNLVLRDCANDHARAAEPDCLNALSASHGALAKSLGDVDPHFFDDTPEPQAKPH
jgi:hypothetical protein